MGYGLGPTSASAFNVKSDKRSISILGDGGFWHNGLTSSIGNAVFNKHDGVTLIVDNFYSAATGGRTSLRPARAILDARPITASLPQCAASARNGCARSIAPTTSPRCETRCARRSRQRRRGRKIIVASSECMLNKQRRVRPMLAQAMRDGKRVVREKFGVDADICTGDHACIRLSGCPSLSLAHSDDPLKDDPVAFVDENCVGCGNCGEVAEAAALCPSFYRADVIHNPSSSGTVRRQNTRFNYRLVRTAAERPVGSYS